LQQARTAASSFRSARKLRLRPSSPLFKVSRSNQILLLLGGGPSDCTAVTAAGCSQPVHRGQWCWRCLSSLMSRSVRNHPDNFQREIAERTAAKIPACMYPTATAVTQPREPCFFEAARCIPPPAALKGPWRRAPFVQQLRDHQGGNFIGFIARGNTTTSASSSRFPLSEFFRARWLFGPISFNIPLRSLVKFLEQNACSQK